MKLLFDYLPYPMKDSDPVVRSTKKANPKVTTNGSNTKITKFFSSFYGSSSNSVSKTNGDVVAKKKSSRVADQKAEKVPKKRGRKKKHSGADLDEQISSPSNSQLPSQMHPPVPPSNGVKRKRGRPPSRRTSTDTNHTGTTTSAVTNGIPVSTTPPKLRKKVRKANSKSSPKLRPRRRASQTYFFKYQLARNPLKAEEEDLKLALLASLEQCDGDASNPELQEQLRRQQLAYENHIKNSKQPKKAVKSNKHQQPTKQQKQKHPPAHEKTVKTADTNLPTTAQNDPYWECKMPNTEDFLAFICFRSPDHLFAQNELSMSPTANKTIEQSAKLNPKPSNGLVNATTGIHVKISNDETSSDEYHHLRRSTSPCKSSVSNHTACNSSPNYLNSPSSRRRPPTRHSPRLASSSKKISDIDSLNPNTAYDIQLNYEEDMEKASIALEDMAQEVNGSDDNETTNGNRHLYTSKSATANNGSSLPSTAQASSNSGHNNHCPGSTTSPNNNNIMNSGRSLSPFKNNKHLVKGLMTREFAGAFADEEIIFENIKNNKL